MAKINPILQQIKDDRAKVVGALSSAHMLTTAEFTKIATQLFKEYASISFVYNNNSGIEENFTINLIIGF